MAEAPLALSKFIEILVNSTSGISVKKAMFFAGKLYKDFRTPTRLGQITELDLIKAGILEKEDRKIFLAAMKKLGYSPTKLSIAVAGSLQAPPDSPSGQPRSSKRKRKQTEDVNDLLPNGSADEVPNLDDLKLDEVLDEELLSSKSTVINRAPLLTAWAVIVAECLGFERAEALSIASVFTEINTFSKAKDSAIASPQARSVREASADGSQPYVDLMGRRIPLYQTQDAGWRALNNGVPVSPQTAHSYITRSFRQTLPYIIGSMRLLAESYGSESINKKAWSLYAEFRPTVDGWGKRGEVQCKAILGLKNQTPISNTGRKTASPVINRGNPNKGNQLDRHKKAKIVSLEEYEAELDLDDRFDGVDLSALP